MIQFLESRLEAFRKCFSRSATFQWFVIIILGLITRTDKLGVTSFVRALSLPAQSYDSMIHFFRSRGYKLDELTKTWYSLVSSSGFLQSLNGRIQLIGDGTKTSKEGRFMPGVKKLFQESENSAKPSYIFGHMFGGLAAVISNGSSSFALPLRLQIQDGLSEISKWDEMEEFREVSHVVQMINIAYDAARQLGKAYLILDRYFLTVPALEKLKELNKENPLVDLITRAKTNCVAYTEPVNGNVPRRGRPRLKGESVRLKELFETRKKDFISANVKMYGKEENVEYLCLDLLWGKKLYQKLRFVLTNSRFGTCIFVSTDCSLAATEIIEAYAARFQIETLFRELKQQIGAFGYHFWSKAMPRLQRYRKKSDPDTLAKVDNTHHQELILQTIRATECFSALSCFAMGLVQMMAFDKRFSDIVRKDRYLRTSAPDKVSEATVLAYLRKHFFRLLVLAPDSSITRLILEHSEEDSSIEDQDKAG